MENAIMVKSPSELLLSSPEKFYREIKVKSYQDVFNSESNGLASIKKDHGDVVVRALLVLIVVDVIDFFNTGNTMSDQQIAQTVDLILEEYYYFKPDDFKLCFNRAKKGTYGPVYNRLDGSVLFAWLKIYAAERVSFAVEQNDSKAAGIKVWEKNNTMDERIARNSDAEALSKVHSDYIREKFSNGPK